MHHVCGNCVVDRDSLKRMSATTHFCRKPPHWPHLEVLTTPPPYRFHASMLKIQLAR